MKVRRVLIVLLTMCMVCSIAYAKDVYGLDRIGKYEVSSEFGKNSIEPGTYRITAKENNSFAAQVSIGDNLNQYGDPFYKDGYFVRFSLVNPHNTKVSSKDAYESYTITLDEGQDVYIHTDSVILTRVSLSDVSSADVINRLSSNQMEERTSTQGYTEVDSSSLKAPCVSSKKIVIDSPNGVEFYTYFGSGIIMSSISGDDCFKMIQIGDSHGVDYYKLMPKSVGKGTIKYTINFEKTISVSVSVEGSALVDRSAQKNGEYYTSVRVLKPVNIRSDARKDSEKVGSASGGEVLQLVEAYYSEEWHQIRFNGKICYVMAKFVELE